MALLPGFKLDIATPEDMPECFKVMIDAYIDDEVWQLMVKDCDKDDILQWTINTFTPRWMMPDIKTKKIVEESSG